MVIEEPQAKRLRCLARHKKSSGSSPYLCARIRILCAPEEQDWIEDALAVDKAQRKGRHGRHTPARARDIRRIVKMISKFQIFEELLASGIRPAPILPLAMFGQAPQSRTNLGSVTFQMPSHNEGSVACQVPR